MALLAGEWLDHEKRSLYISELEQELELLRTIIDKGIAVMSDLDRVEFLINELERVNRIHRGEHDFLYFMYEYFSDERNPSNSSNLIPEGQDIDTAADFHKELCSILDDVTQQKVSKHIGWSVGRNHAKTAYLSNGYSAHQVVYRLKKYIVVVSETTDVASDFIAWVRYQLKFNAKLREDFGSLLEERATLNELDNQREFITSSHTKVEAKGSGTQMRGLRHLESRPDLFILDDLESHENTNTPELRAKNLAWFRGEMLEALGAGGMAIYMGTIVHFDSLLNYVLTKRKDFTSRKFPAITSWSEHPELWDKWREIYQQDTPTAKEEADAFYEENKELMDKGTKVLWEGRYTYKYFMEKREEMGNMSFNREYLGNPIDEESQIFNPDNFVYYDEYEIDTSKMKFYAAIDLAMGKERGDYSAIVTLGKYPSSDVVYVIDAFAERMKPDQFMLEIVSRAHQYEYEAIAVESNNFQEWFADQLQDALQASGYPAHTRMKKIVSLKNKMLRIEALQPEIETGRVRLNRRHTLLLEMLEMYPNHNHDDLPDALAEAVKLAKTSKAKVTVPRVMDRWGGSGYRR